MQSQTHAHTHAHARTHARTHTHTHTYTHARTNMRANTHTHHVGSVSMAADASNVSPYRSYSGCITCDVFAPALLALLHNIRLYEGSVIKAPSRHHQGSIKALAGVFSCLVSAHALLALLALLHNSKRASRSAIPAPEPPSFCISVITTLLFLHFFLYYYYCFFFAVLHWHICIPALLQIFFYYGITTLSGRKRTVLAIPSPSCCGETRASCCPLFTIEKQAIFTTQFTTVRPSNTEPSLMR